MHIVWIFFSIFACDIFWNIVHRPGPIKRDKRNNVFKRIRFHFAQHIAHTGTFQLKNADSVATPQKLKSRRIIQRQIVDINVYTSASKQLDRFFKHGQRF